MSDGLEAVQRTKELQPDLILLDISLPTLNGIEAARQMRDLAPQSRILFLSAQCSLAVVQEDFRLGARGYIVKSGAGSELLTAINTVLRGEKFVSSSLAACDLPMAAD